MNTEIAKRKYKGISVERKNVSKDKTIHNNEKCYAVLTENHIRKERKK